MTRPDITCSLGLKKRGHGQLGHVCGKQLGLSNISDKPTVDPKCSQKDKCSQFIVIMNHKYHCLPHIEVALHSGTDQPKGDVTCVHYVAHDLPFCKFVNEYIEFENNNPRTMCVLCNSFVHDVRQNKCLPCFWESHWQKERLIWIAFYYKQGNIGRLSAEIIKYIVNNLF